MSRRTKIRIGIAFGILLLAGVVFLTIRLNLSDFGRRDFAEIKKSGRLRVVTEKSSLGFKLYNDQIEGFNYEIVKAFADSLGLELEINIENNLDSAIAGVLEHRFDLIALNIPNTTETKSRLALSIPLLSGRQMLVQQAIIDTTNIQVNRNHHLLTNDSICIPANSPFRQRLKNLSDEIADTIRIVELSDKSTEDLVLMVSAGKIKYTLCDELQAKRLKRTFTNIDISTPIGFTQQFCWGVNPGSVHLRYNLNAFLHDFLMSNDYWKIYRKYY